MTMYQSHFSYEELIEHAHGRLFGSGYARLPLPPLLMIDRITSIDPKGGISGNGYIEGEFDIHPDLWFFKSHFESDPVMPGCLGLDAMWQLVGFFVCWLGNKGKGRALGVGDVKLQGMVLPDSKMVSYHIDIKRIISRKLVLGIGDGVMKVDGKPIYQAKSMRVGMFDADSLSS